MLSCAIVTPLNRFAFQRHGPGCTAEVRHSFLDTRGQVTSACYSMYCALTIHGISKQRKKSLAAGI